MDDKLSLLIDQVIIDILSDKVVEYLNQATTVVSSTATRYLVVLTGDSIPNIEQIIEKLSCLSDVVHLDVLLSHSAEKFLHQKGIDLIIQLVNVELLDCSPKSLNDYTGLIFPELSINSLAKGSMQIADNLATCLMQQAFLLKKPLLITIDYLDNTMAQKNGYQQKIVASISILLTFGIKILKLDSLANGIYLSKLMRATNILSHELITQADIRLHDPQYPLYLSKKSLVTPLAKDLIHQKNIQIIRQ